jgi:5-methyltetrahydrofolate--homocysteine methyltransferase
MRSIVSKLSESPVLVSDGAWGTELYARGMTVGECPELWCVDHREDVLAIAKSYIDAGADIIGTNSFGGTSFKLEAFGVADRVAELNEVAAAISREAAGAGAFVIGSVGPTGKMLLMGDVSEEELYEGFREQAVALALGGADACCIETMSAIDEAALAVRAVKEHTDLEAICTFTFEKTVNDEFRTMMGVSPTEMAAAIMDAGADIIGTNCGNGMKRMVPIVKELRAAAPKQPILVHANAGMPVNRDGKDVFPDTPGTMADLTQELVSAGACIIGGCCGTSPEHIAAIARVVKEGHV